MRYRPMKQVAGIALWCAAFGWVSSCTFSVDLDPLNNQQCSVDSKACGGRCVPKSDPTMGCALLGCAPCTLPHATATCAPNGQCLIAACEEPYRNCNNNNDDGCEVNIRDSVTYCGSSTCDTRANDSCNPPNAERGCSNGKCAIGSCKSGYSDCDGLVTNGCEANTTTDPAHCGSCTKTCTTGQTCVNGTCT